LRRLAALARDARVGVCADDPSQIRALDEAVDRAGRTRDLLACHDIECPTISSSGTGSFEFEAASGVYTELQCGSYIFMDSDYGRNLDRDGAVTKAFEPSLFVWATVMSRPAQDRAIVDAGLKALAFDSGPPLVCDEPAATDERASGEHGMLAVGHGPQSRRFILTVSRYAV
jgi:D-serine deaminase-like pyridoxal phosphate-dependent protein